MRADNQIWSDKIIKMMTPAYPWTVKLLTERCDCPESTVRSSFRKLSKADLIEKYSPDDEMTYRMGIKWRLTEKGLKRREQLLHRVIK